ncbi:BON domain-containing protein [Planosporangium sp. 12N6]|uniref:BON domain-containing protein n=1 Tax=Planosporangium spinosum TaxID=3402278 RepID=UPI003CF394F1
MATATEARVDERIQLDLIEELNWDARVQPNEIGVAVKDGIVTLMGWVDSYARKWVAERIAHRIRGVRAVANDIEVRLPTSAERTDAEIARVATHALDWDTFVPAGDLEVTVSRGWVILRGEVTWEYERRAAERTVRRLAGVRGVTNLITVRPRVASPVEDLTHRIERAMARSAATDARLVEVEAHGDTVTLTGTVQSSSEREEAERVAWSAPGVSHVDNRIVVGLNRSP